MVKDCIIQPWKDSNHCGFKGRKFDPYTPPILEEGEVINTVLLSLASQVSYGKSW